MTKRTAGFTLIEIMLVVTIIGILAAVVLPRLAGRSEEARVSAARMQIENIGVAMDSFEVDNGRYPTTSEGMAVLTDNPGNLEKWKGPYLKKKISKDPWGTPYQYTSPGIHNKDYDLKSFGPNKAEGGNDDVANWE